MNETFKLGEIAIFCRPGSPNYGQEVTVISSLKKIRMWNRELTEFEIVMGYQLEAPFMGVPPIGRWASKPCWLRKKRLPPQSEDVGDWELCPWKPEKVPVGKS